MPIAAAVFFIAAFADFYMKIRVYTQSAQLFGIEKTYGNALMSIFGGVQEFDRAADGQFIFPAVWILMYLLLLYLTLYYPYNNLEDNGKYILVLSGSRKLWWCAKCVWNVCSVVVFFLIGYAVIALGCAVTGMRMTTDVSPNIWAFLNMRITSELMYPEKMTLEIMIMPAVCMIALNLLEMALSLFIRPIFSFIICGIILLASAYFNSPFLIGCYACPVRSAAMIRGGLNMYAGLALAAGVAVISVIAGCIKFSRYDALKRGG